MTERMETVYLVILATLYIRGHAFWETRRIQTAGDSKAMDVSSATKATLLSTDLVNKTILSAKLSTSCLATAHHVSTATSFRGTPVNKVKRKTLTVKIIPPTIMLTAQNVTKVISPFMVDVRSKTLCVKRLIKVMEIVTVAGKDSH